MTWYQTIFLAILQGVSELFPVSSLGHTVIVTRLVGWQEFESNPAFLPFVVLLHVGTATALLVFFWRDWVRIIGAIIRTAIAGRVDADPHGHLAWMVVAGTIPAGLIGVFLEQPLKQLFSNPPVAATFLAINGLLMLGGERLRRRALATAGATVRADGGTLEVVRPGQSVLEATAPDGSLPLSRLTLVSAVLVGLAQALALIPGISRSGVTMVAGLLVGMSHEDAATFTFLLATPIIAAAGLLEIPILFTSGGGILVPALVGGVVAGFAAYLSVRFLMKYFETGRLDPFGYYCLVAGIVSLIVILR